MEKKLKIAVGLFGIHYIENLNFWMGGDAKTDYKDSLQNKVFYQNYKISNLENDITYFGSTYFSNKLIELIEDYNFKKLKLSKINNNYLYHQIERNKRFNETIELILSDDTIYDFVILTRFDVLLKEKIYEFNLNLEKVNVLYDGEWEGYSMIDDNFYILSYDILNNFYKNLKTINENNSSHYYHHYIGIEIFNILSQNIVKVHNDASRDILYHVTRTRC